MSRIGSERRIVGTGEKSRDKTTGIELSCRGDRRSPSASIRRDKLASLQSYATFPRSTNCTPRGSPHHSGRSTPHTDLNRRPSLPTLSSSVPTTSNLSKRLSGYIRPRDLGDDADPPHVSRARNRWDSAKYEDPTEEVARSGDVTHWRMLSAAVERHARTSPRERNRTRTISREHDHHTSITRDRVRSITQSETLAEEPESYASTTDHVDGDSDEESKVGNPGDVSPSNSTRRLHSLDDASSEADEAEKTSDSEDDEDEDDQPLLRKTRSSSQLRPPSLYDRSLARVFPLSLTAKNVLKCVLAYFLASLFTFIPQLSDFVGAPWDVDGPVRNAHAIATVSVYFMPAKTIGGIFEVDIFLALGAIYAVFLTTSSMAFSVLCERMDVLVSQFPLDDLSGSCPDRCVCFRSHSVTFSCSSSGSGAATVSWCISRSRSRNRRYRRLVHSSR